MEHVCLRAQKPTWYSEGSGDLNLTRLQLPTEAPSGVQRVLGAVAISSEQKGNLRRTSDSESNRRFLIVYTSSVHNMELTSPLSRDPSLLLRPGHLLPVQLHQVHAAQLGKVAAEVATPVDLFSLLRK